MKKIIIYSLVLILLISIVNGLGISPSRNEIYYSSGETRDLSFRVLNNQFKETKIRLIARGELAEYVEFEKELVDINTDEYEKTINYKINMPSKLEPGVHDLEIIAVESGESSENILVANIGVMHKLSVRVPYPDQYLEGILYLSEARPNEEMTFTITISNVGSKNLNNVKGSIIITGPNNEGVARIDTNDISLNTQKKSKITATWIANVNPGTYHAQAIVDYDNNKVMIIEKDFDVGTPLIDIKDVKVASFKLGTIAKLDISVENKWNQNMPNVYGITEISDDNGVLLESYKTSSVDIPPLGQKELNSYWDTKDIEPGEFIVSVKANYLGRVREKVYDMSVKQNEIIIKSPAITGEVTGVDNREFKVNNTLLIVIVVGLFIIVIIQMVLKYLSKSNNNNNNNNKPIEETEKKISQTKEYPELRKYIKTKLSQGYSRESIRHALLEKGWNIEIIDYEMMKSEENID